jgi:hypothetical protein
MINKYELERTWKEVVVIKFRYYMSIYLEKLRKTIKNLSQKSWSLGRDPNLGHPKYNREVLTAQLHHSAFNADLKINSSFNDTSTSNRKVSIKESSA